MVDNILLLFGVALFIAVVLGLESAYIWWNTNRGPEARRIERRLKAASAGLHSQEQLSILKDRALSNSEGGRTVCSCFCHAFTEWTCC